MATKKSKTAKKAKTAKSKNTKKTASKKTAKKKEIAPDEIETKNVQVADESDTAQDDALEASTGNETLESTPFSYDELPYESFPYSQTHPPQLATIATIFGLETPDFDKMRVLELGCAAGGNIIPLAHDYPDAEFVGIDLSKEQIDKGKKQIKDMKLKNIKLDHLSIADIKDQYGTFDYIICHGVFSWVPDEIAEKILNVAHKSLSPEGLAIISYNCLPGWSAVSSVRDMMIYHTRKFDSLTEKAEQAKRLVDFLHKNCDTESPYKGILENEKKVLGRTRNDYIAHEYLEDQNTQYYFYEFIEKAQKHDLQYVGDTSLATMYYGNMPDEAAKQLQVVNDMITQEQYMDFIRNRRFRYSILTHADRKINRKITPEAIEKMYVVSTYKPEGPITNDDKPVTFVRPDKKMSFKLSTPVQKLAFAKFGENAGNPVKISEMIDFVAERLDATDADAKDAVRATILDSVAQLALKGMIKLTLEGPRWTLKISEKPRVSDHALYLAGLDQQGWVVNGLRSKVSVTLITKFIISQLDGTQTIDQVVDKLIAEMEKQNWKIRADKKVVEDEEFIRKAAERLVRNTIAEARRRCMLVA